MNKDILKKKGSTLLLKAAICFIGLVVLTLCAVITFQMIKEATGPTPFTFHPVYPIVIILFSSAIPFFIALNQAWKLLRYVDQNTAFSDLSIKALKKIKYCAITISLLYVGGMPALYTLAQSDDAPGIILFGMIFVFVSGVIATFSAVLEKLLQNAIDIKAENDLTI